MLAALLLNLLPVAQAGPCSLDSSPFHQPEAHTLLVLGEDLGAEVEARLEQTRREARSWSGLPLELGPELLDVHDPVFVASRSSS